MAIRKVDSWKEPRVGAGPDTPSRALGAGAELHVHPPVFSRMPSIWLSSFISIVRLRSSAYFCVGEVASGTGMNGSVNLGGSGIATPPQIVTAAAECLCSFLLVAERGILSDPPTRRVSW